MRNLPQYGNRFFLPAGRSTRILFVSVSFWREPRVETGRKNMWPRVETGRKKGLITTLTVVSRLLAGFVAAFVISYTGIVFKDVGLRFLS